MRVTVSKHWSKMVFVNRRAKLNQRLDWTIIDYVACEN
jgi:hypothetical protein